MALHWRTGLAGLCILLHACTTAVPSPRETLAVIDVPEPANLMVHMAGHPDATSTQVRQVFYGQQMARGALDLADAIKPLGLHPGAMLEDALTAALARPNRDVIRVANPQKERSELLTDYTLVRTTAGRALDVVLLATGYWNVWPTGPYHPWVVVAWRLRDNNNGATIAAGQIGSGPALNREPIVDVQADERFAFADFDAVLADPGRAAEGLRTTIRQIGTALASRLRGS